MLVFKFSNKFPSLMRLITRIELNKKDILHLSILPKADDHISESKALQIDHQAAIPNSISTEYAKITVMKKQRLYVLDLLRFIAALAVVAFHYTAAVRNTHGFYLFATPALNSLLNYGYLGAELFFLISGFVILMSAQNVSVKNFIKSRVIRLYPAFIPICILSWVLAVVVYGHQISLFDGILNLSMIGLLFTNKLISGVYWTLAVEIQFYILIIFLIFSKQIKNIRIVLFAWLAISIISHLGINYYSQFNYFRIFNILRKVFFTQFSSFFIAGCYFYLIKFERRKYDIYFPFLCMLSAIFLCPSANNSTVIQGILISIMFLIFNWIILRSFNFRFTSIIMALGSITYPLYLMHEAIGEMIIRLELKYSVYRPVIFISTLLIMIISAFIFHSVVERPFTKKLKSIIFNK